MEAGNDRLQVLNYYLRLAAKPFFIFLPFLNLSQIKSYFQSQGANVTNLNSKRVHSTDNKQAAKLFVRVLRLTSASFSLLATDRIKVNTNYVRQSNENPIITSLKHFILLIKLCIIITACITEPM